MIATLVCILIFGASLFLILSEKLNRTIVGMAGAALTVGAGRLFGFYSEHQAIAAVDLNTIGLLLGMMILVALLEPTGFFQYLAVWAGRWSRGSPVRLLVLLGTVTTVLSMFLDNVTTVVLIAPVTILISEILGMQAMPLLVSEALLSNTGGVATLVGDPPNILIASAAGFSFNDFLTHALPVVAVAWLTALLLLRYLFRAELAVPPTHAEAVLEMNPAETLNDWRTARRVLIVLAAAILTFFVQEMLHLTPAFIALSAAAAALVWVRPDLHRMFQQIEWSVLIFFAALFVMVGGLEAVGVLHALARLIEQVQGIPSVVFGVAVIWIVALSSAVIDNVPITMALIPVIQGGQLNLNKLKPCLRFCCAHRAGLTRVGGYLVLPPSPGARATASQRFRLAWTPSAFQRGTGASPCPWQPIKAQTGREGLPPATPPHNRPCFHRRFIPYGRRPLGEAWKNLCAPNRSHRIFQIIRQPPAIRIQSVPNGMPTDKRQPVRHFTPAIPGGLSFRSTKHRLFKRFRHRLFESHSSAGDCHCCRLMAVQTIELSILDASNDRGEGWLNLKRYHLLLPAAGVDSGEHLSMNEVVTHAVEALVGIMVLLELQPFHRGGRHTLRFSPADSVPHQVADQPVPLGGGGVHQFRTGKPPRDAVVAVAMDQGDRESLRVNIDSSDAILKLPLLHFREVKSDMAIELSVSAAPHFNRVGLSRGQPLRQERCVVVGDV